MPTLLRFGYPSLSARCQLDSGEQLTVGSPIIIVEAPPTLKTATPMPSLKINSGLVKEGDVGRIIARKPKDVWAVRLAIGAYLLDGKYFKPLDISE
ncbi:protein CHLORORESPIRATORY REDUCTION 42, chloroplastic [Curcuma longa]|uniref:protein CHLORORESPIRATORY REDUCTION 42, chloroplastic n=1 Tax=Curcuma longa TaxID=136217 RepID=UPI003D9F0DDD